MVRIKEEEITLEDLELAIRIIEAFTRKYERAQKAVRRFAKVLGRQYRRPEDLILEMMFKPRAAEAEEEQGLQPVELTEEDKKRLEELKKKVMRKYQG